MVATTTEVQALGAGFDHHLVKPVGLREPRGIAGKGGQREAGREGDAKRLRAMTNWFPSEAATRGLDPTSYNVYYDKYGPTYARPLIRNVDFH